jgi:hypothetical protein
MPLTADQLLALAANLDNLAAELLTEAVHAEGQCNCENSKCPHGEKACHNKAGNRKAMYVGALCNECADRMPEKYMKKDAGQTDEKHPLFMEWLAKHYGYTHEQYSIFSREAKNHLHNIYENETRKENKKEAAGQTFDEKEKEDKEWQKSHPKMRDWSGKDWKKYLSKDKKDSNDAKDKKKLDPKAKVRSRGKCVVPAEKAIDHNDHYPINNIEEGRAALRYVGKQKSAPWYRGSVESLRNAVERAVHSAFPELKKNKKKSSALEVSETLLAKYS